MLACPHVFVEVGGTWRWHSVALRGLDARSKQATEVIELGPYQGAIELRELEPETTYLDSLAVEVSLADGSVKTLFPPRPELRFTDGRFLPLRRGETLTLPYEHIETATTARLVVNGYYRPWHLQPEER